MAKRIKLNREQWAFWRNANKTYLVEEETGLIGQEVKLVNGQYVMADYETGEPTGTSAATLMQGCKVMNGRDAVRYQIRTVNDGNDCLILALNGTVIGTTRSREKPSAMLGTNAGVPIPPSECVCKNYAGTPPSAHHPVCLNRQRWEQRASIHQNGGVQSQTGVALVPNYPMVNTLPPKPKSKPQQVRTVVQAKETTQQPSLALKPEEKTNPATPTAIVNEDQNHGFTDEDFELGDSV